MLLGGKGGCQQCTCVPCDACTRTCTEPHTGTAFGTVCYFYALGAQAGNPTDGYLTASGSVDASDPYDGMDGSSPYYQEVSGSYSLNNTQTRVPCVYRVSFWRSNFPLGPVGVPPPSSSLTKSQITVSCSYGAVRFGEDIIRATESKTYAVDFPIASGTGDQSGNGPRSLIGTWGVSAECDSASFTITARIEWTANKRQHVLYGKVVECYEESTPTGCCPSGKTLRNNLYVTISGYSYPGGRAPAASAVNGTYVVERVPTQCLSYALNVAGECEIPYYQSSMWYWSNLFVNSASAVYMQRYVHRGDSGCVWITLVSNSTSAEVCDGGTNPISSWTGDVYVSDIDEYARNTKVGTFNWKIEA